MGRIDVSDFLKEFDETGFPSDFLREYELLECLSQNEINETFLIKSRDDGVLRVAKCYKRKKLSRRKCRKRYSEQFAS